MSHHPRNTALADDAAPALATPPATSTPATTLWVFSHTPEPPPIDMNAHDWAKIVSHGLRNPYLLTFLDGIITSTLRDTVASLQGLTPAYVNEMLEADATMHPSAMPTIEKYLFGHGKPGFNMNVAGGGGPRRVSGGYQPRRFNSQMLSEIEDKLPVDVIGCAQFLAGLFFPPPVAELLRGYLELQTPNITQAVNVIFKFIVVYFKNVYLDVQTSERIVFLMCAPCLPRAPSRSRANLSRTPSSQVPHTILAWLRAGTR